MNFKKIVSLFILCFLIATNLYSQNVISGLVVDSLSLNALPDAHIRIKNSSRATKSNSNGSFIIMAADYDTIIFSFAGYNEFQYPLLGPETDILIRMSGSFKMLKEVTINATPPQEIMEKKAPRYTKSDGSKYTRSPTPTLAEGISSPFTYFSKTEREKRMLVKLRTENKKIKTYIEVVNDPETKKEVMKKFALQEKSYYEILAKFNQSNQALYISNPVEIKRRLINFINSNVRKK